MAAMADAGDGAGLSVVDRLCAAAGRLLPLNGAGVSLLVDGQLRGAPGVSGAGAVTVHELQLTLGEGPCIDAWTDGEMMLEPDLADPAMVRWPAFARGAQDAGVRAVFAFPLQLGAISVGVLVLYRDRAGPLSADELGYALVLAELGTVVLLGLQSRAEDDTLHELLAGEPAHWAEIHQATGMIAEQLGVSLDEAFVRLRAHAFGEERPLREIAREVIAGCLRLENAP